MTENLVACFFITMQTIASYLQNFISFFILKTISCSMYNSYLFSYVVCMHFLNILILTYLFQINKPYESQILQLIYVSIMYLNAPVTFGSHFQGTKQTFSKSPFLISSLYLSYQHPQHLLNGKSLTTEARKTGM